MSATPVDFSARTGTATEVQRIVEELRQLNADVSLPTNSLGETLTQVDLGFVRDKSHALRLLAKLPRVDRVSLQSADLQAEDFKVLGSIATLRWLDLSNTKVQDADLSFLAGTPRLQFLLLWSTDISDAGLVHLARLSELQKLDLSATRIKGTQLESLATLNHLLELHLEIPNIDEAAVNQLQAKLPNTLIVH